LAATGASVAVSSACSVAADHPHIGSDPRLPGQQVLANGWFRCSQAHRNVTFQVTLQLYRGLPGQAPRWYTVGGARTRFPMVRRDRRMHLLQPAEQACNQTYPYRALAQLDVPRPGRSPIKFRASSATVTLSCK
jgi:hypothetical protein